MEGKQVTKVRTGEVVSYPGSPQTEAILLEFSDGSQMSIEAATNISQIIREDAPIDQNSLHIRFILTYVPEMLPYSKG